MLRLKADGSGVSTVESAGTDVNTKLIDHPNIDAVLAAIVLVMRDEFNTLRTLGIISLGSWSVDDWKTKIAAKLP